MYGRPQLEAILLYSSGPQLSGLVGHTLVTLCNRVVILFGGRISGSGDSPFSNPLKQVWAFVDRDWSPVEVLNSNDSGDEGITARSMHSAVSVRSNYTHCRCNESVLVFGGIGKDLAYKNDLWELRCVDDQKKYKWFLLDSLSDPAPSKRYGHAAVTDASKGIMYIYGGRTGKTEIRDLWSYALGTKQWTMESNNGSRYGISAPTFFRWDSMYLEVSEMSK